MLIGYARVSTQDQNLDLQTEALTKVGCKKIYNDKISGSRAERPGLTKALEMLREGDTLVVWKLDRLARSVKNLVDLVGELHQQGIQFKSLTDAIDTGTPSGRFFFHVMASLAEMERELTVERTRAGLEVARLRHHRHREHPDGGHTGRRRHHHRKRRQGTRRLRSGAFPEQDGRQNQRHRPRRVTWPRILVFPFLPCTAGFLPQGVFSRERIGVISLVAKFVGLLRALLE